MFRTIKFSSILVLALILVLYSCTTTHGGGNNNNNNSTTHVRGLGVDHAYTIVGDSDNEKTLLDFAELNEISYLALYQMDQILNDISKTTALDLFIKRAQDEYSLTNIVAVVTDTTTAQKVIDFNNAHSYTIDAINYECEYWNASVKCPSFSDYKTNLIWIHNNATGFTIDATITSASESESADMKYYADRIFIRTYVAAPSTAFNTISTQLLYISPVDGTTTQAWPVFSNNSNYMGGWLSNWEQLKDGMQDAENTLLSDLESSSLTGSVELSGFWYFKYSNFSGGI
ncbi:MAG: hypothetical protein V1647_04515 [Pseudomonadota bacterium]